MCRAGTGPDGNPIHADIVLAGLKAGAAVGDLELGDVTVRNFVGGQLSIMHNSDVDPRGVHAGNADKAKNTQSPSRDREISGCMALVLTRAVA